MKILGIILIVAIIGLIVLFFKKLKDRDGDGDIDLKDAKLTAKDIKDDLDEGVKEVKHRAKRVKQELKDVKDAVKEVGNQVGDVTKAAKGKPRTGRKPRAKKTKK
jgi:hypothetical protein